MRTNAVCAWIVMCALCVGLLFAAPVAARADGSSETINVTSLFTPGDGVTVTANKTVAGYESSPYTGLVVESASMYTAEINGVFRDEFHIKFSLVGGTMDRGGSFTMRFTDMTNAENYFDVKFDNVGGVSWQSPRVTVICNKGGVEKKCTSLKDGTVLEELTATPDNWADAYNSHLGGPCFNDAGWRGYLRVKSDNGTLTVTMSDVNGGGEHAIARFDGTSAINNGTTPKEYGMPNINFAQGYKVTFSSDWGPGTDILIDEMGETGDTLVAFGGGGKPTEIAAPAYYTAWKNVPNIVPGDVPSPYHNPADGGFVIPTVQYYLNGEGAAQLQNVSKVTLAKEGESESIDVTDKMGDADGYAFTEAGTYTLTYTAVEGATNYANTLRYTVCVGNYMAVSDLIDTTATLAKHAEGLLIANAGAYDATVNGVFTGDFSFVYSFIGVESWQGLFTIRFTDAQNPAKYFEVQFDYQGSGSVEGETVPSNPPTRAIVQYYDGTTYFDRTTQADGTVLDHRPAREECGEGYSYGPHFASTDWIGKLEMKTVDGKLGIYMGPDGGNLRPVAVFDDTSEISNEAENKAYGLPDFAFEHGYRVSFVSNYGEGTDILIRNLNGLNFSYMDFETHFGLQGNHVLTLNGEAEMTVAHGAPFVDPGAVYSVSLPDAHLTDVIRENVTATQAVDTNTVNADGITLTYSHVHVQDITRIVKVTDQTAPVITITGDSTLTVPHGNVGTAPEASATDNVDTSVVVTNDWTTVITNTTAPGTYTVTYTATDAAGNRATATLTVTVADQTAPVITIAGGDTLTVPQGNVGSAPEASATDNVDTSVVVTNDWADKITNTTTPGTYTVTYTATDAAGNTATATLTVTVEAATGSDDKKSGCGGCGGRIESWHCIAVAVILMGLVVGIMLFKKKRV